MKKLSLLCLSISVLLFSCKDDDNNNLNHESEKQLVKETYANLAFAVYDDSYKGAEALHDAIDAFLDDRTAVNFEAAKQAWLDVREAYGQSETFRFADGPIDNPADGPEGLINAWPLDEAYVDYVVDSVGGVVNTGIVNDAVTYPNIDEATLLNANEAGADENISLGFHAIEFLLWGQDLSSSGAGARPYTDYLTTGGTADNQERRAEYLEVSGHILLEGIKQVRDEWDPAISGNYRGEWLALADSAALRKMLNSIKVLSGFELAGERIFVAYEGGSQEDEHSCFSDNTHRDIILNAKGMDNLYKGTYTRTDGTIVSGYALEDLVDLYDAAKNDSVLAALAATDAATNNIYVPFDQAIVLSAERPKVLAAVEALQHQEVKIREAAAVLDIVLP